MPPKRAAPPTQEEFAAKKQKKAEYDRQRRARLSEVQREHQQEANTELQRQLRSQQDQYERQQQREADARRHAESRAELSEQEQEQINEIDRERRQIARTLLDEVEQQQQKEADARRHAESRAELSEQEQEQINEIDRERRQLARTLLDVVERQQQKETHSQQRRDVRSQMSDEQLNLRSQEQREYREQLSDEEIQRQRIQNTEQHRITYQINMQSRVGPHAGRFNRNIRTRNIALQPENFIENSIEENYLGQLNNRCPHCNSKNFKNELKSNCCHSGTVMLNPIEIHPDIIYYMTNDDTSSKNFRANIRSYNSAMAFASMGAQVDESVAKRAGPFCYRIHGAIYHKTSGLHPNESATPKYSQLYILDTTEATNARMNNPANSGCIREVMENLQNLLEHINPFAKLYKHMLTFEQAEIQQGILDGLQPVEVRMTILRNTTNVQDIHPGRLNVPNSHGEIAAVFENADGEPPFDRDIVIHSKSGTLQNISILSKLCDPMCYPLLFPHGDLGWTINIPKTPKKTKKKATTSRNIENDDETNENVVEVGTSSRTYSNVSHLQWYSYHFAIRDHYNQFLNAGKLTHQFLVDAYCKVEAGRLQYFKANQKQIRAEDYDVLTNYINNRATADNAVPGKKVILPSTFQGSPRNMQQNYQDAMAMVRKYGKPDLFVTFTCNARWKEITENLLFGQQPSDRPDLIARVFNMKLKLLLKDIMEKHIFGRVIAILYVIEFQKRGLPHAHILAIMVAEDKVWEKERIDKIVSAQLPDKETHPRLFEVITRCMIHGTCGQLNPKSPCMENGKCTKDFPKEFCNETDKNVNGYPKYERKDDGNFAQLGEKRVDNRWVVPYNPYLSLKYNAHINVEICTSIKSVKYLFKYVYKGHDCANVQISTVPTEQETVIEWDEVKSYLDTRYVSAPEACWRLREYDMHHQNHTIVRLPVHLEEKQSISFQPELLLGTTENVRDLIDKKSSKSKLLAWFKLNQTESHARDFFYIQIPEEYTWNAKDGIWKKQIREALQDKTIGRMYNVSPTDREKYFLRILLLHVKGATCFEDMKMYDEVLYETYQEALQEDC